jgi:mannosyltransferase OCH1-like enzyme
MIPKIIHAFAPSNVNDWHETWKSCYDSWFKCFDSREFQFVMWSHEASDNFVKKEFPEYFNFYQNLTHRIMKVDIGRLLVLHKYGGIYHDMDVVCYNNFYNYILKYPSNFYITRADNTIIEYISNCLMASIPLNDFLIKCVDLSKNTIESLIKIDNKTYEKIVNDPDPLVLYLTGPVLLQNTLGIFFNNYKKITSNGCIWFNNDNVHLLPINLFNSKNKLLNSEVYTQHLCSNVWFKV